MTNWVFDAPHTRRIADSRTETLDHILESLSGDFMLKTALDVGTGLGEFAGHLDRRGMKVTAVDVRPDNVKEAKCRHPSVDCQVCDVERENVSEPTDPLNVHVTSLDEHLGHIQPRRVDLIKIDAEGAEAEILAGATETLDQFQPLVFCELADVRTKPWGYGTKDIWEFLQQRGYAWFSITAEGRLDRCELKETFSDNLVAVPIPRIGELGHLFVTRPLESVA